AIAGSKNSNVALAVTIVIGGHRDIVGDSPPYNCLGHTICTKDPPGSIAWPVNGYVGFPISVVVGGHGNITSHGKLLIHSPARTLDNPPGTIAGPKYSYVALAVTVVISGYWPITGDSPSGNGLRHII